MKIDRKSKGIVFFMTVILLTIAVLICAAITVLMLGSAYNVTRMKYATQAYCLAEAGIEEALKGITDSFDYAPTGYPKYLGAGSYSVTVSTHPTDTGRKLITSAGTVKDVSKYIKVQVQSSTIEAFDYPALGGGKVTIAGGSVVSDTVAISVHSNSDGDGAVQVGDKWGTGRINGNASALGTVQQHSSDDIVTGTIHDKNRPPVSYVELPPFDDNFFQYYYNLALNDTGGSKVYSGIKIFADDPFKAGTTNHVVYVDGQVRLVGTWSMTGCIVATGKIIVNKWASGHIDIHKWQNLPALMSKNSDVEIYDPTDIEGMIYANGYIEIDSIFGDSGPSVIYGSLYGKSWVNIKGATALHYVKPSPPGLPSSEGPSVSILDWSE